MVQNLTFAKKYIYVKGSSYNKMYLIDDVLTKIELREKLASNKFVYCVKNGGAYEEIIRETNDIFNCVIGKTRIDNIPMWILRNLKEYGNCYVSGKTISKIGAFFEKLERYGFEIKSKRKVEPYDAEQDNIMLNKVQKKRRRKKIKGVSEGYVISLKEKSDNAN